MLAEYMPPEVTTLDFEEAAEVHRWGLAEEGSILTDEALALGMSKTALESGRWKKMHNWNFGNVKCPETQPGMFTSFACNEVLKGETVWFAPEGELDRKGGVVVGKVWDVPPGHPQTRFAAFANRWDGIERYVSFLQRPRYLKAYRALLSGSAPAYVRELRAAGYFTAPEDQYLRGVASMQREFVAKLRGLSAPEAAVSEDLAEEVERLQKLWFAAVLYPDESGAVS